MNAVNGSSALDWVLVLAPFRKDADYIAALLIEQNIAVHPVQTDKELALNLTLSPGVIVVTHEALSPEFVATIGEHIAHQPHWSEVPILVLLERAAPISRIRNQLDSAWLGARIVFHTRPIARLELVNSIQSNLLVRLRQKQVRDAIESEVELRLELNHRIKNILASVTSIFQMTRRGAADVEELARDFKGRLQALSDVHTTVFEAGTDAIPLSSVIGLTVSPYNSGGSNRIHSHGPEDTVIGPSAATTLALCLHELVTNAIKYGALSQSDGKVDISWSLSNEDASNLSLDWIETGGPNVTEPTRQGYGTKYIRAALGSLFGSPPDMTFAPDGFRCHISGPLDRLQES